jgi:hypothetical protein
MQIIHSRKHQRHGGAMELNFNRMVPMFERLERMDAILKELDRRQFGILIAGVEDPEPYFFG